MDGPRRIQQLRKLRVYLYEKQHTLLLVINRSELWLPYELWDMIWKMAMNDIINAMIKIKDDIVADYGMFGEIHKSFFVAYEITKVSQLKYVAKPHKDWYDRFALQTAILDTVDHCEYIAKLIEKLPFTTLSAILGEINKSRYK